MVCEQLFYRILGRSVQCLLMQWIVNNTVQHHNSIRETLLPIVYALIIIIDKIIMSTESVEK